MISVVTLFIALICYFHYNQLPIYNLNLAYKFIKNSTHKENFELLSSNLGYNLNDKLLLIHADDLGLSESVNETSLKSLLKNTVSSFNLITKVFIIVYIITLINDFKFFFFLLPQFRIN